MSLAVIASAAMLGLIGSPHCAAMCSAPCTLVTRRCAGGSSAPAAFAGFMTGRLIGYATAGAVVATGVLLFGVLGQAAPALRPLWTVAHAAVLALGLWLLLTGRQPVWWARVGTAQPPAETALAGGWQRLHGPARASAAGALWLMLPCGLLQSALLVAALSNTAWEGAAAMAAFALTSSLGLGVFPALWGRGSETARSGVVAVRLAGVALVATSGWALGHGLWERVAALCGVA